MGDGFKQLKVGHEAKALAVDIDRASSTGSLAHDFGLRDQLRRAAVRVPSHFAEGDARDTDQHHVRFHHRAKGSLPEPVAQIEIAAEIGVVAPPDRSRIQTRCQTIGRMRGARIKSCSAPL